MRDVPAQQQHLDQGPGALGVAVGLDRRRPPRVVDGGELARGAGLFQRGRTGKGARLADQSFEVVSLDALDYDWPCGFARFEIAIWNPERAWFSDEELTAIGHALGHPVQQVRAHI
ncbi:hypothetical protein [Streptomyces cellulosae]|uniref:hypothetical protein n=1 Tax=Streptomyces cellulosae TaxID=1968 RepID=UPI0004C4C0F6|nr:hypothetical protein [Streptomyces cellulosae]